jgi:hypothetical protein
MHTLSKSDFQLASSCSKKLVYKKAQYPTVNDTNEYMEMLAQGGYIVGHMATLMFPEGIEITGTTNACLKETEEYLQQQNCTLFEAAIQSGQKIVRIDILKKVGNKIQLIEVKSKSYDSEESKSKNQKELQPYFEDVAYQYYVLREAYPHLEIECSLLMPDKAMRSNIDGLAGWFRIDPGIDETKEIHEIITQQKPRFTRPEVVFKFEHHPERENFIHQLLNNGILDFLDVTEQVLKLQPIIHYRAERFLDILNQGIQSNHDPINKKCKTCEFNSGSNMPNGFKECWGDLAERENHIFDLYFGNAIGHHSSGYYFDELIEQGKTSLFEIDFDRLKNAKGELGSRGTRQTIQIENTRNQNEWISPDLSQLGEQFTYPLHFIDFETYTGALPFHAGMRPYELIAFQWSCHTIQSPGAAPVHHEWIHTGEQFPNFEFAESLMQLIGYSGTPFMWATHENTVLRGILGQMDVFEYSNDNLSKWLTDITKDTDRDGRLVDMNRLTAEHYFHPYMKGRTSIKKVLPAIWNHHEYLHQISFFKEYSAIDLDGRVIDPYDTLVIKTDDETYDDVVKGGTDAMRAYQRIRFDDTLSDARKEELKNKLLKYCKLDTMAMVIIAHHWGIR